MNVFEESIIKDIIGSSSAEYMAMKETSSGDEKPSDPIAVFLDTAHGKEGAVAEKGKDVFIITQ